MKKSFGAKTLIYPAPVWLIGTYDKKGDPDAATVAWAGICGSDPPAVAISLRKSRYSYENILYRKAFTVNVPSAGQVVIADYCGLVSGRKVDKFATAKINAVRSEKVDASYIDECPMVAECKLVAHVEVGIHVHLIGEICDVKVDESLIAEDHLPDIMRIQPLIYAPERRSYHTVGPCLAEAFSSGKKILNDH
ncbi:MAG TPA: flavin reductase family protein [Smithella sp.]|nr:flavin reductase family protein [Smithella sp.]